jgi:hypothetical protein
MPSRRDEALKRIERNIEKSGFHIYIVGGGAVPRFSYTIGLREMLGAELVLAGALYFESKDDVLAIIHALQKQLERPVAGKLGTKWSASLDVGGCGAFTFRKAHSSWVRSLLLGALDYYQVDDIDAYQIVPDAEHRTIDVPNLAREWNATTEPVWQWLNEPWPFSIPSEATAMTDLAALRGAPVTEACRWEDDYWEMTAAPGPDVPDEEARIVPLATLIASDSSLRAVVDLEIGAGLWRESDGAWNRWEKTAPQS